MGGIKNIVKIFRVVYWLFQLVLGPVLRILISFGARFGGNIIQKVFLVYGLVLAIVLRIIIPFSSGSEVLKECPKCTKAILTYYSTISSILFITATLLLLNIRLADLIADLISLAYIPLLIIMIRWTYYATIKQLSDMLRSYSAFINIDLKLHWVSYQSHHETYWPDLEKKLHCCGYDGPRTYMEYMQKVPGHCYTPKLITLGCHQLFRDTFYQMRGIGYFLRIITLFTELCLLFFHGFIMCKKLVGLIAGLYQKRVSKPSLTKSS